VRVSVDVAVAVAVNGSRCLPVLTLSFQSQQSASVKCQLSTVKQPTLILLALCIYPIVPRSIDIYLAIHRFIDSSIHPLCSVLLLPFVIRRMIYAPDQSCPVYLVPRRVLGVER
jgi:hypothetical protein